jgi:EAL domain-containing protein (putative c-di-GMP-specific phosphodiesterase class I)
MDARMKTRRELEIALRKALAEGDFELHYQPLVSVHDNRIVGCEALLRWRHPERGMISPAEFIPVAEEIGLIVPLGEWVLRKACADAARWPEHIKVAVNLSAIQVMNQKLVPVVIGALAAAGLPAKRLEIEITESVLMHNTDMTMAALHRLRELGVSISMDDFGTGYSSLSYLRSFPFDKIKIDRCFISGLPGAADSVAIVRAVTGLAKNLNMVATAEGVETQEQLEQVRALGCSEMQGYLFSPPLRLEKLAKLLEPYQPTLAKTA